MHQFNAKPTKNKLIIKIDLHGKSLSEAEEALQVAIQEAYKNKSPIIEVITGIGNHPNQDGRRGLIFKAVPKWLVKPELQPFIQFAEKKPGYYLIGIRPQQQLAVNPVQDAAEFKADDKYKAAIPKKTISKKHPKYEKEENALMQALQDPDVEIDVIDKILSAQSQLLTETLEDGTSALMRAASNNRVDVMECMLLKDPESGLLKMKRDDGVTPLMIAVSHGHLETTDFLLKKAPSLLKRRSHNGCSVFQVIKRTPNASLILGALYEYLKPNRRDRGYTGLFREYQERKQALSSVEESKRKVLIVDSVAIKKRREKHSWFFMDRISEFLGRLKIPTPNLESIKIQVKQAKNNPLKLAKIKKNLKNYLKIHNVLRHLFLRFNNRHKPVYKKQYKHAIRVQTYPFSPAKKGVAVALPKAAQESLSQNKKILNKTPTKPAKDSRRVVKPLIFSNQYGLGTPSKSRAASIDPKIQNARKKKSGRKKPKRR